MGPALMKCSTKGSRLTCFRSSGAAEPGTSPRASKASLTVSAASYCGRALAYAGQ